MNKEQLQKAFVSGRDRYIAEWMDLLRFPSISAEPARAGDCADCARWLARRLAKLGMKSSVVPTSGRPVVYAERTGRAGKPTLLFYGHYDVQPVDPVEQWKSDPFSPVIRNGRVYARGAEDNKGQIMYVLAAMDALCRNGSLGFNVKVILEGEEECGGHAVESLLPRIKSRIKADIVYSADAFMIAPDKPTITMGLRGIGYLNITLTGPSHDLHSGMHGGRAPNPAEGMAHLVSSLYATDGSIAVKGFYQGVNPPSAIERRLARRTASTDAEYKKLIGTFPVAGEKRFSHAERVGFRPHIDVNGIHAGYGGTGTKTVIPSSAIARLSVRFVPGQDPVKCTDMIVAHLERNTPRGMTLEITERSVSGGEMRLDVKSPVAARVISVLKAASGRNPVMHWEGASVPIVAALAKAAKAEPVMVGFGREEDHIHAPNECFSLEQFRQGFLFAGLFLSA